jgi:hypothetical protein
LPGSDPDVEVSPDKTVATVEMEIAGNGTDAKSEKALEVLRNDVVPPTIGAVDGVETYLGGATAQDADFNDTMSSHVPYVFAFVLSAAFLLLLVTFRSIVVPIKAIVLNLLSVAASYGVMVLVFQHGWGKSLLTHHDLLPLNSQHSAKRLVDCPVIVLIHAPDPDFIKEASKRGIFAFITDAEAKDWQSSIDIVLRRFAEYHDLEGAFGRRAVTERAKGILMERHSVDEAAAFQMLRNHARAGNRMLVDIAATVVDGHPLLPTQRQAPP